MSESSDQFLQANEAEAQEEGTSDQILALKLPPDLAILLQRYSCNLGQPQAEVIVSLLRSALAPNARDTSASLEPAASKHFISNQQELQALKLRLDQLESLKPRLELLEGKCIAF